MPGTTRHLTARFALALTLLASLLAFPRVADAALSWGSYTTGYYVPLDPVRIVDTRAPGEFEFKRLPGNVVRVKVTGRPGVASDAVAAVVNITMIRPTAKGNVVAYPAATPAPATSNVNADAPGRVIANMAHVKLNSKGYIDLKSNVSTGLVVDLIGVYRRTSEPVAAGRMVVRPRGTFRAYDSRISAGPMRRESTRTIDLSAAGIPATASAVVIAFTAVKGWNSGFFTVFPASSRTVPETSTLNLDTAGQTRAAQAIVRLDGSPRVKVFSKAGGDVIVDVVGWYTGDGDAVSENGLFLPLSTPRRALDTRTLRSLPAWAGSTFEFVDGSILSNVAAVAANITATQPWQNGYITAYAARTRRPTSSNLNLTSWPQTIANHAVIPMSTKGGAVYTYAGAHMLVDIAGLFTGTPTPAKYERAPRNPDFRRNKAVAVSIPELGKFLPVAHGTSGTLDAIADRGLATTFSDLADVAAPGNMMIFAHRTSAGGPFRYINTLDPGDTFSVIGSDGNSYNYLVIGEGVTSPSYWNIYGLAAPFGPVTAQLVACSRADGSPTSLSYRVVVTGRLISVT